MTLDRDRIRDDFDRLAAFDHAGWSHNSHYHPYLLRHLPDRPKTALDVGCGTGVFSRLLATRCEHVTGIDLSGEMIRLARERSVGIQNIHYEQADMLDYLQPSRTFEVIASIATLHHLSLETILPRLREALQPGGVLLVLDLYTPENRPDLFLSGLTGMIASRFYQRWHRVPSPSAAESAAWDAHGAHDVYPRLSQMRQVCVTYLPGARVRKHLLWRYSLTWRKPA